MRYSAWPAVVAGVLASLAGCATPPSSQEHPATTPSRSAAPERRAVKATRVVPIVRLLPPALEDRSGWAGDIETAMAALRIEPSVQNVCAVVAITAQESGFRADPQVPGLPGIARSEIEKRRNHAGIPKFMVRAALALPSSNGRSYSERLDRATTERQLSEVFEDFSGRVPLAKTFFADRNPVRTGGPMQVSFEFAQAQVAAYPYPYPRSGSIREEVFTRRGGLYFGIAHLLHYPAPYDSPIYRFADFNAGRFASRNAAFQKAVSELSGVPLELDGDLLRYDQARPVRERSFTEAATCKLAERLGMSAAEIRRDLELGSAPQFERSKLYGAVFALADASHPAPAPRAVMPSIVLQTSKTTRRLTTEGFAQRVAERYRACLARA